MRLALACAACAPVAVWACANTQGEAGYEARVSLLTHAQGEAGYQACVSLAGAGPWRLTSTNVLAVSATPVVLASAPPPRQSHQPPSPRASASAPNAACQHHAVGGALRNQDGKGARQGGGSELVLHSCWLGGLGGKSGQRAMDGVVVLGRSSCFLLASVPPSFLPPLTLSPICVPASVFVCVCVRVCVCVCVCVSVCARGSKHEGG